MYHQEYLSRRKAAQTTSMNWGACAMVSRTGMHVLWNPPVASSRSDSMMSSQHQEISSVPCFFAACVVTCICSAGRGSGALGCTQVGLFEIIRLVEEMRRDESALEVLERRTRSPCAAPLETNSPLETSSVAQLEQQVRVWRVSLLLMPVYKNAHGLCRLWQALVASKIMSDNIRWRAHHGAEQPTSSA